jgi:hypothetical protein
MGEDPYGIDGIGEVCQGFSHAHENYVGNATRMNLFPDYEELGHDFSRAEVSQKPHLGCPADSASHGASHLSRQTECIVIIFWYENRFYAQPIFEAQEKFLHSVAGFPNGQHPWEADPSAFFQLFSEGSGEVAHLLKRFLQPLVYPLHHLGGPVALLPQSDEKPLQFRMSHANQVWSLVFT